MAMKIARVTCWILRMPYEVPLVDETRHHWGTFVEIETDDGLKGHALATTPMRHAVREFINKEAGPSIIGMDASRPEAVRNALLWGTVKLYMGAWSHAASLIDIALWDLKGKALGSPIWRLLGGSENRLPAYITFGFSWADDDLLVALAKKFVGDGQKRLKMTVGSKLVGTQGHMAPDEASIEKDIARVRLVREAIGPDVKLMLDGNNSFRYPQALKFARSVEEYDLTFFEDALLQSDPRLLADMRTQTKVPLAAGSSGTCDLVYLREYLIHRSVDYLQPNVRDIGGFTQGVKAAALAKAFNVPLAQGGNYPHQQMHLLGGVAQDGLVEFHIQGWPCVARLFDGAEGPAPDGTITLPERPGLGYTPKLGILDLAVND